MDGCYEQHCYFTMEPYFHFPMCSWHKLHHQGSISGALGVCFSPLTLFISAVKQLELLLKTLLESSSYLSLFDFFSHFKPHIEYFIL